MTTTTVSKSVKGSDLSAPRDINENTKARRAWLAETLATVLAESDTDQTKTKIVGIGSYQRVSVWKIVTTTVEGRERFRGVCQFCGREQVVDGDRIVLHGYNRPGHGYIVGECPAAKDQPLNSSDAVTRKFLESFRTELPTVTEDVARLEHEFNAARRAAEESTESRFAFHNDAPRAPRRGQGTPEALAAFHAATAEHAAKFPLHTAMDELSSTLSARKHRRGWLVDMIAHLEGLLAANILGTPLTREVVA